MTRRKRYTSPKKESYTTFANIRLVWQLHFTTKFDICQVLEDIKIPSAQQTGFLISFYCARTLPSPSQEGTLEFPNMMTAGIFIPFPLAATTVSDRFWQLNSFNCLSLLVLTFLELRVKVITPALLP